MSRGPRAEGNNRDAAGAGPCQGLAICRDQRLPGAAPATSARASSTAACTRLSKGFGRLRASASARFTAAALRADRCGGWFCASAMSHSSTSRRPASVASSGVRPSAPAATQRPGGVEESPVLDGLRGAGAAHGHGRHQLHPGQAGKPRTRGLHRVLVCRCRWLRRLHEEGGQMNVQRGAGFGTAHRSRSPAQDQPEQRRQVLTVQPFRLEPGQQALSSS
jgi:hypothetical protein